MHDDRPVHSPPLIAIPAVTASGGNLGKAIAEYCASKSGNFHERDVVQLRLGVGNIRSSERELLGSAESFTWVDTR